MLLLSHLAQIVSILFMKKSANLFASSSNEPTMGNGFSFLPWIKLNRFLEFVVLTFFVQPCIFF